MKKSAKFKGIKELEELPKIDYVDFSSFPEEVKEALGGNLYTIYKKSKLSWDGKQFIIRIPKEIAQEMEITKESQINFKLTKPEPGTNEKRKLSIELVVNDGS